MKNSQNIVLIALLLIVLGCNCQKTLDDMAKNVNTSTTTNSSNSSNSTSTTTESKLTLEKFNKIQNGMTYKEVVDIIGSEGELTMSSGDGKYKVESYKWEGERFQFISIVMSGGKVTSKTQANLK